MLPGEDFDVVVDMSGLDRAEPRLSSEEAKTLRRIALDLLGNAIEDAPVEEGTLRGSGSAHFEGQRIATSADFGNKDGTPAADDGGESNGELTATVVFNTVYAAAQHEGVEFAHPKGGKAKYLEDNVEKNRDQYLRLMAEAAKRAL